MEKVCHFSHCWRLHKYERLKGATSTKLPSNTINYRGILTFLLVMSFIMAQAQVGARFSSTLPTGPRSQAKDKIATVTGKEWLSNKSKQNNSRNVKPQNKSNNYSGIDFSTINKIKENTEKLFTAINDAFVDDNYQLSLDGIPMTNDSRSRLSNMWKTEHFTHLEDSLELQVLNTYTGYQLRNIPLNVLYQGVNGDWMNKYEEAVIDFNEKGEIVGFNYCIAPDVYGKQAREWMEDGNNEVKDARQLWIVRSYVEQFRTAYTQKDMDFMKKIFSDDALIVKGTVIKPKKTPKMDAQKSVNFETKIIYNKQTKKQYLHDLGEVFRKKLYIDVTFDSIHIQKHPDKEMYGVLVRQFWSSTEKTKKGLKTYSDEGYVLIIWDFQNPDAPEILVRTWQPVYINKETGEKLSKKDILQLGDFPY